jgi:hypothetical protein
MAHKLRTQLTGQMRKLGGGRTPLILWVLEGMVARETAGDPMTAQKSVRSSGCAAAYAR